MFIRLPLRKLFRLYGRSRKTQPTTPSSNPNPNPNPNSSTDILHISRSAIDKYNLNYSDSDASSDSDDHCESDLSPIVFRPSLTHHIAVSRHPPTIPTTDAHIHGPIPTIVVEANDTPFELISSPTPHPSSHLLVPPTTFHPTSLLVPTSPDKHKTSYDGDGVATKVRAGRSKSILFAIPSVGEPRKMARRATMGGKSRRERESKVEFKWPQRRESSHELDHEPKVLSNVESNRKSKRESKRLSRMSERKEKRQSRWEKEINDPDTQEVLRALSTLN